MLSCKCYPAHPNLVQDEVWFVSPCCTGMASCPWSHHPCLHPRWARPVLCPPVISSGLISASNSSVMRVTSLLGELRARRPFPFLDESHLRLTKVTWQSEHGAEPPVCGGQVSTPSLLGDRHPHCPPPSHLTLCPGLPGLLLLALGPRVQVALGILDLEGGLLLDRRSHSL